MFDIICRFFSLPRAKRRAVKYLVKEYHCPSPTQSLKDMLCTLSILCCNEDTMEISHHHHSVPPQPVESCDIEDALFYKSVKVPERSFLRTTTNQIMFKTLSSSTFKRSFTSGNFADLSLSWRSKTELVFFCLPLTRSEVYIK